MINVLYLINHAGKAGTEKYVYNLVSFFHGKKTACFFAYNEPGLLSRQMGEKNIPSFKIKMRNPFDFVAAIRVARLCRKEKIDVIHTQFPRENYIAVLSKLFGSRARVVYTCHLTLHPSKIWHIMNRVMLRFDDRIISVCNNGKDILCETGAPQEKIRVIYNGIPYPGDPVKSIDVLDELRLNRDTFVIITLSRCSPEKGLSFLARSMKALKEKTDKPFVCLMAGDGPQLEDLRQEMKSLGVSDYVLLLGFRGDVDKLLSAGHVFINSAQSNEALSFAILEAMGHGLPIIAADTGGNPDIVKAEHGCGELVPYGDTAAMSEAVLRLMNDGEYYKKCSEGSLKTVREVFLLDKLLEETFEQYIFEGGQQ